MPQFAVTRSSGIDYFYKALTSDTVSKMSGGKIPKMTPEQASGLIGSWIVETGNPKLNNLDVVERGAGAGRGLSQYTGERRVAYDAARAKAIQQGIDPNSPQWQLKYFVQEYTGQHDRNGASLIGWTRVFENAPAKGSPADFARYFTGSADSGQGYFRPGVPHTESRQNAAQQVFKLYGTGGPAKVVKTPSTAPTGPAPAASRPVGSRAVLNGKPVVWGGDNYGWQSPASFSKIPQQPAAAASRPGVLNQLQVPSIPSSLQLFGKIFQ